jgi:type I restriction enzyme S subunit
MKYPAYEKYKDSGVSWLGTIPKHWDVRRIRFACLSNPIKSELKNIKGDEKVSFVPMEAVGEYGGMILETEKELNSVYNGYTYFAENDVVVAKITPCFENGKGAIARGLTNGVAFGTTELHVLRPFEGYSNRFIFYLSISNPFREIGASEMLGAGGQKRVPENFLKNFRAGMPGLTEQEMIADFLDQKTAQIDQLIGKKQALIEKLNEKRTAMITRAVTKGLDESVPMKDSGVEWLGKVPEHWEVKKTKFLTQLLRGQFSHRPRNDPDLYDGEYPFIQTGDVSNARKYIEKLYMFRGFKKLPLTEPI